MKKVSIISPVYNVEKHIKNMIISVINQTYRDFELLLVDDGSTDNSIQIAVDELNKTDINYRVISKLNGGQSSARNIGFDEAKGEYVCSIDSDDIIQKDYLSNLVKTIEETNSDVVFCDLNWVTDDKAFDEKKDDFTYNVKNGKDFFCDFFLHNVEIGPYSLLIKRDYLNKLKLRYNEKSRYSEEFIFICYLLHDAKSVTHLKQRLYNYCLRGGSVSTSANTDKILNGYNEIIKFSEKYKKCNCYSCKLYNRYAIPRWILATARFTAKNLKLSDYRDMLIKMDYRTNVKKLYSFPKLSVKFAAFVLNISLSLAYFIFKKVGVR